MNYFSNVVSETNEQANKEQKKEHTRVDFVFCIIKFVGNSETGARGGHILRFLLKFSHNIQPALASVWEARLGKTSCNFQKLSISPLYF